MPKCQCIAKITNLQCKKFALKDSLFCEIHQHCLYTIRTAIKKIPADSSIIKKINNKLMEAQAAIGKNNKLIPTLQMYDLLITPEGLSLLKDNPVFKATVTSKLIEFIEVGHFSDFIPYYEKITNRKYFGRVLPDSRT